MPSPEDFTDADWRAIQTMFVNDTVDTMKFALHQDFLLIGGQIAASLLIVVSEYTHFRKNCSVAETVLIAEGMQQPPESQEAWYDLIRKVRKFCDGDESYMVYILSRISERMGVFIHEHARTPWTKAHLYRS